MEELVSDTIGLGLGHIGGSLLYLFAYYALDATSSLVYYSSFTLGNAALCLLLRRHGLMPLKYLYLNVGLWPALGTLYWAGQHSRFIGDHFSAISFLLVLVAALPLMYLVPFDSRDIRFRLVVSRGTALLTRSGDSGGKPEHGSRAVSTSRKEDE